MVIPVVFLLLVVVSPTAAITLDTDGGFNGGLGNAGRIGGGVTCLIRPLNSCPNGDLFVQL
jgi:hypothetical protein